MCGQWQATATPTTNNINNIIVQLCQPAVVGVVVLVLVPQRASCCYGHTHPALQVVTRLKLPQLWQQHHHLVLLQVAAAGLGVLLLE